MKILQKNGGFSFSNKFLITYMIATNKFQRFPSTFPENNSGKFKSNVFSPEKLKKLLKLVKIEDS